MRRRTLLAVWAGIALLAHVLPSLFPGAPARADLPETSANTLDYRIDARLNAKTRQVAATGSLTWRNRSPVPVTEMRLHLYLNAFKNERSTFMRESQGAHRGHKFDKRAPGSIDLTSFKRKGGPELRAKGTFGHEDDGNKDDETVIVIPLDEPVPANGEATFELAWKSTMPKVFARTGFGGDGAFFMVAQWYPKPGVWEQHEHDGKSVWHWNCHQFHGSSEFYSDYGTYDVRLTVPARFESKLGSSGKRADLSGGDRKDRGRKNEDGTFTYRHQAVDVHDFAWVCGEDFLVEEIRYEGSAGFDDEARAEQERVAKVLGRSTEALDLPPVTVYFLLQPEHEDQLERHRKAVFSALTYMGIWFGKYPYETLTVVDPDHRARDAGGMEYPTLITGGTRYIRPSKQLSPEGVLVHEFGHQHFYGLVGSNEFRSAWMDEGMCTYATGKVLMKVYDGWTPAAWYGGFPVYGEAPFAFEGLAAESRKALPFVEPLFDDKWTVPFGDVGLVKSIAGLLGSDHPPERISLWGKYGDISPLAFLREVPTLTHLQPLASDTKEYERGATARRPIVDPIAGRRAWEYMNRSSYGTNSYRRPASSLRTLGGYVGADTMTRIMRTYCERYRFEHPKPEHFYATAAEVAAKDGKGDIRWLLEQLFQGEGALDFGIESIDVGPVAEAKTKSEKADKQARKRFESTVLIRRYGGMRIPMDILVRFDDGLVREFQWGRDDSLREYEIAPLGEGEGIAGRVRGALGKEPITSFHADLSRVSPQRDVQQRWAKLRFRGKAKVVSAEIDPYYVYSLDRDRTNDGRTTERNVGASLQIALRALGWVQLTNSFYGGI